MRIAFGFLKDIQEKFFERYPKQKRDAALPFSLSDFKKILEDRVALFNDKTKVDKFCALQKYPNAITQRTIGGTGDQPA
jgi:hypothetical protein